MKRLLPILVLFLLWPGLAHSAAPRNEQVVLLHGILRSSAHMEDIEKLLEAKGYVVFNLDYPSTSHPLEVLTAIVAEDLR